MYDTIIIGAGMSGLAAGIRLAHFGRRVCVLERHTAVGGLNSFYRRGGRDYDVGLHAVTNYRAKGSKPGPLGRILRQLRLNWDDLDLAPQVGSSIRFPGVSLDFSNDFGLFHSEVNRHFPRQKDRFQRFLAALVDYNQFAQSCSRQSARQVVGRLLDDPLLVEMIFCPVLCYGGARPHDMDFGQFSMLFRAIFLEGLGRPRAGARRIVSRLVDQFSRQGGELRLRTGVSRIRAESGVAKRVVLDDGTELEGRQILSSAGWPETMRLCDGAWCQQTEAPGPFSLFESISILDAQPKDLGLDRTVVFFNDSERFHHETPDEPADLRSGVVCSPNNFAYDEPLAEGVVRVTALANYDRWAAMDESSYRPEKRRWYDRLLASAVRFVSDFRNAVIDRDVFTPVTIRRYTGREKGAVYGLPEKRRDGTTHLENLFVCGTDQGIVGIVGAMISGITMANRLLLPRRKRTTVGETSPSG